MTRRTRITVLGLLVGLFALTLGLTMGTRSLRVVIANGTLAPLVDVEISHSGGTYRVDRIDPEGTVEATLHRPLAGLWGKGREVPLTLQFTQRGTRSDPFQVRCELGWFGARRVDLRAKPLKFSHSIDVTATMNGHHEFYPKRLILNTLSPGVGPRRFYSYRRESTGATVIRRPDRIYEARRQIEAATYFSAIWLASQPVGSPLVLDYAESLRNEFLRNSFSKKSPPPRKVHRLPFRDLREARDDLRMSLVQSPLLP